LTVFRFVVTLTTLTDVKNWKHQRGKEEQECPNHYAENPDESLPERTPLMPKKTLTAETIRGM